MNRYPSIPVNTAPANGAAGLGANVTLRWTPSVDSDGDTVRYDVYLWLDGAQQAVISASQLATQKVVYNLPQGIYEWFILAKDGKGGTASSPIHTFTVGAGTPPPAVVYTAPADGSTNIPLNQVLVWQACTGGAPITYDVYFSVNQTLVANQDIAARVAVGQLGQTYTPGLVANQAYYWRVVARNNWDTTTGTTQSFTTGEAPSAPVLVTPADGDIAISLLPDLDWNAPVSGSPVTFYSVYLNTDGITSSRIGRAATTLIGTTTETEFSCSATLTEDTEYEWKVKAENGFGSTNSVTWRFTTVDTTEITEEFLDEAVSYLTGIATLTTNHTTDEATFTFAPPQTFRDFFDALKNGFLGTYLIDSVFPIKMTGIPGISGEILLEDADQIETLLSIWNPSLSGMGPLTIKFTPDEVTYNVWFVQAP